MPPRATTKQTQASATSSDTSFDMKQRTAGVSVPRQRSINEAELPSESTMVRVSLMEGAATSTATAAASATHDVPVIKEEAVSQTSPLQSSPETRAALARARTIFNHLDRLAPGILTMDQRKRLIDNDGASGKEQLAMNGSVKRRSMAAMPRPLKEGAASLSLEDMLMQREEADAQARKTVVQEATSSKAHGMMSKTTVPSTTTSMGKSSKGTRLPQPSGGKHKGGLAQQQQQQPWLAAQQPQPQPQKKQHMAANKPSQRPADERSRFAAVLQAKGQRTNQYGSIPHLNNNVATAVGASASIATVAVPTSRRVVQPRHHQQQQHFQPEERQSYSRIPRQRKTSSPFGPHTGDTPPMDVPIQVLRPHFQQMNMSGGGGGGGAYYGDYPSENSISHG